MAFIRLLNTPIVLALTKNTRTHTRHTHVRWNGKILMLVRYQATRVPWLRYFVRLAFFWNDGLHEYNIQALGRDLVVRKILCVRGGEGLEKYITKPTSHVLSALSRKVYEYNIIVSYRISLWICTDSILFTFFTNPGMLAVDIVSDFQLRANVLSTLILSHATLTFFLSYILYHSINALV